MPELITPKDFAKELGISAQTVRLWLQENKIPYVKIGSRYRIDKQIATTMLTPQHAQNSPIDQ